MKALVRALVFAAAGLAQAVSIAAPWNGQPLWWLQLLSTAALVWQLDALRADARPGRRATLYGWLFATTWLCGTFWWLFISMHTYGGMPAPLAAIAVLALAAGLALYYAVACGVFVRFAPTSPAGAAVFFAALWLLAELLRNSWFTGFPWGAGGYAHVDGPLAAYAPWLGVYGLETVAVGAVAMLVLTIRRAKRTVTAARRVLPIGIAAALLLVPGAISLMRDADDAGASRGHLKMALLQGNIPQDEKFIPGGGIATALQWYGAQLRDATAPLVVTPETAFPLLPAQLPAGYLDAIAGRYASGTQAAIIGLPLGDGAVYTNSVLGFRPGEPQAWRYDKHHLVPFGEFVPGVFRWFTDLMHIPLGDFGRGGLAQAPFVWQGQRIAANICYEDLFGDEIGANFRDPANAPTMLLNVSNIAWFGDSVAIDQHLAISRMRALEFQRPMVRATNTGATVVIDHRGRVTAELPRLTRGVLTAEVEGRAGVTPFAWWVSRFGLWPFWAASLLTIAFCCRLHQRRKV